ncbi:dual specificity protein phosphatase 18-like [Toxorhynchites rutilus septentrionalis]|uniref:dual specificity protein phosphatase 18-like n=1 Tax=Toxorhynchites rutilus septentrionalis TaxID=329112 RepID=UPI0024797B6B|nr:dual specificity protein phosphatase 18-like [Toxorhynchites rutilus septentrionalis]
MKVVNINSVNHQHHLDSLQTTLMEDPITPKATSDVVESASSSRDSGGDSHGGGGCYPNIALPGPKSNHIQALFARLENPQSTVASSSGSSSLFSISGVSKLLKNLYLCGGSAASVPMMKQLGVSLVINATTEAELPNTPLPCDETTGYLRVPVKDNREEDLERYFDQIADRIEQEYQRDGVILVHCVAGVSRSASLCLAYLIKYHQMSLKDAYNHVKTKRPQIRPNVAFVKQLMEYEFKQHGTRSVSMVYCHALDQELPDIYEPEFRTMEMLYQKFRRNIAKR